MKKLVSMVLAVLMILSLSTVIFAVDDVSTTLYTSVTVNGSAQNNVPGEDDAGFKDEDGNNMDDDTYYEGTDGSKYYVTVPATLKPGATDTKLRVTGVLPSDADLTIAVPKTVTLANQDADNDTKPLGIAITGNGVNSDGTNHVITIGGNSMITIEEEYSISIDDFKPTLGEWIGEIEYVVTYYPDGING